MYNVQVRPTEAYAEISSFLTTMIPVARFRSQRIDEDAPQPIQDTTEAGLIKHCEEEHPVGWATLRNGNKQKKRPEEEAETPV